MLLIAVGCGNFITSQIVVLGNFEYSNIDDPFTFFVPIHTSDLCFHFLAVQLASVLYSKSPGLFHCNSSFNEPAYAWFFFVAVDMQCGTFLSCETSELLTGRGNFPGLF